jgi:hypothetical protein
MKNSADTVRAVFKDDELLAEKFYREDSAPKARLAALDEAGRRRSKPKPDHYEIICISMYNDDLARLDAKVEALKARGNRRMTRSALIRYALDRLALDDVPRGPF